MRSPNERLRAFLLLGAALGASACMKANGRVAGGTLTVGGGPRGEILAELARLEKRAFQLLEAIPQEKLSWRPAEDVRSASALFVHIGNAPHFISGALVERPSPAAMKAAITAAREAEKTITDKAALKAHLEKGFAKQREAIESVSDAQLDDPVKGAFGVFTKRFLLGIFPRHLIGHLGQLGIYARMVGVTPPWVHEERKRMQEMMKKQMGGGASKTGP